MDRKFQFTVLGTPRPKQGVAMSGKRVISREKGKRHTGLAFWIELMKVEAYEAAATGIRDKSLDWLKEKHKNLAIELVFLFETKDQKLHFKPKPTRPDYDNLDKPVLDVITELGIISDDAVFVDARIRKFYGPQAGLVVTITEYDDTQPFPLPI